MKSEESNGVPIVLTWCVHFNPDEIVHVTTLNNVFSVAYYLELRNAISIYLFYQQMPNWLFGHYTTFQTIHS